MVRPAAHAFWDPVPRGSGRARAACPMLPAVFPCPVGARILMVPMRGRSNLGILFLGGRLKLRSRRALIRRGALRRPQFDDGGPSAVRGRRPFSFLTLVDLALRGGAPGGLFLAVSVFLGLSRDAARSTGNGPMTGMAAGHGNERPLRGATSPRRSGADRRGSSWLPPRVLRSAARCPARLPTPRHSLSPDRRRRHAIPR